MTQGAVQVKATRQRERELPADLEVVLRMLVRRVQAVLGENFVSAALQGSFATDDWDEYSDVDFLIVIERELTPAELAALQVMHGEIFEMASPWAQHLDGSYIPREVLWRYDADAPLLYYLDNGSRELIPSDHDNTRVVRWVAREYGRTLAGEDIRGLIEPVPAAELRQEVRKTMRNWAKELFADPQRMNNGWYQPFVVLSYCRMLQTLQSGRIESKAAGVQWALENLDGRWAALIEQAWAERPNPEVKGRQEADPKAFARTLAFMVYALDIGSDGVRG